MTGIELIAQERKERIEKHGRTVEQDVRNNNNRQLIQGATVLTRLNLNTWPLNSIKQEKPPGWNPAIWERMCKKPYLERLAIAGALVAAEIDMQQYDGE